jgi:lantibiotic modifying enzyme
MLGDLRDYAGRAASLFERLTGLYEVVGEGSVSDRLDVWRGAVDPGGHPNALVARLAHLKIRQDDLQRLLGDVRLRADAVPPWWLLELRHHASCMAPSATLPEFCTGLAMSAVRATAMAADGSLQRAEPALVDRLVAACARKLESTLSDITSTTVLSDQHATGIAKIVSLSQATRPAIEVLSEYPVGAKLTMVVARSWMLSVSLAMSRLKADRLAIERVFDICANDDLIELDGDMSDPHEHGATVLVMTFVSGRKLVYKPKPLDAEIWFQRVLNSSTTTRYLTEAYPQLLLRRGYGWSAFVVEAHTVPATQHSNAVIAAGHTLHALYVANATDIHFENVRMNGSVPVVVDCETMQHPAPFETAFPLPIHRVGQDLHWRSVLRTLFLPQWMVSPDASPINVGGLEQLFAENGVSSIDLFVSSFEEAYQEWLRDGRTIPAVGRPRHHRFLVRPTNTYAQLVTQSRSAELLRSGIDRSLALEVLGRYYVSAEGQRPMPQSMLDAEIASIERLDIPKFSLRRGDRHLRSDGRIVCRNFLVANPPPRPVLSAKDLTTQVSIVRSSVLAHLSHQQRQQPATTFATDQYTCIEDRIHAIAADMLDRTVAGSDGGVTWLSVQAVQGTDRYQFGPIDASLYDGIVGVALFLLWYGKLYRHDHARETALAAVRPIAAFCRREPTRAVRAFGCGGMQGIGAVLYVLGQVRDLSGDLEVEGAVSSLLESLAHKHWPDNAYADFVFGTAGLLTVLLRFQDTESAAAGAIQCADHLFRTAVPVHSGGYAWRDPSGRFQTGFSHGSAGIAHALARWSEVSGCQRSLALAQGAWKLEDHHWWTPRSTWAKYADRGADDCGHAWCHGAPGILLGRLAQQAVSATAVGVRTDLSTLRRPLADSLDQVCCGHLGRALIASDLASFRPGDIQWLHETRDAELKMMLASWNETRRLRLLPGLPDSNFHVGLMQGTAGIGLGLMSLEVDGLPKFWRLA